MVLPALDDNGFCGCCIHGPISFSTPLATQPISKNFPALPKSFFCRPAEVVGPELIGCLLVKRQLSGELLWGVIVETEAYSQDEPACHGYRRRSPQNETLWEMLRTLWLSPGQQKLPFAFDIRLNQIPEEWHQVAVRFRRANGIRDGDMERRFWQLR